MTRGIEAEASTSSLGGRVAEAWRRGFASAEGEAEDVPAHRIRNFSIIAHIDHGKSTLADRLLQSTGTVEARDMQAQYLDDLAIERERGITVKLRAVRMRYEASDGHTYALNLIDTPGHVDFSYEVSRSLAACEGALLVVDAAQGVEAQTLANVYLALEDDLDIIPVINKIDLPGADVDRVAREIEDVIGLDCSDAILCSAKQGVGIDAVLEAIVSRTRPPRTIAQAAGDDASAQSPLRALIFDAHHDAYTGVCCLVCVKEGSLGVGDAIMSCATGTAMEVLDVGFMAPNMRSLGRGRRLRCGEIGYVTTGLKHYDQVPGGGLRNLIGDTLGRAGVATEAFPGFAPARSMCFGGVFPESNDEYDSLCKAIDRLTLTDSSVTVHKESSAALGLGFRCGFLGLLHMEVFMSRLEEEFGQKVIATKPFVPLRIVRAGKGGKGEEGDEGKGEGGEGGEGGREILSPAEWPGSHERFTVLEPTVLATIVCPSDCVGKVISLCHEHRGMQQEQTAVGAGRVLFRHAIPLPELAGDFYDKLKAATAGYATLDYEEGPWRPADLVKLDVRVNGEEVDALAQVVPRASADRVGRALVVKLKDILKREQFDVALQAAIGSRIIARETLKAVRKNVLAKCYGGDVSRKKKLLKAQARGKRRLKRLGGVNLPVEVFPALLRTR